MTTVTLTDDEVAALCIATGSSWPVPLPTVALTVDDLIEAAKRGRRSLLARGLIESASSPITDLVKRAATSTDQLHSYVAEANQPGVLAGSSSSAFLSGDGAVIDLVSGSGIHELTITSPGEAIASVVSLARRAFDYGFQRETGTERLILGRGHGSPAIRVRRGHLETGGFEDGEFAAESETSTWDDASVRTSLGLGSA